MRRIQDRTFYKISKIHEQKDKTMEEDYEKEKGLIGFLKVTFHPQYRRKLKEFDKKESKIYNEGVKELEKYSYFPKSIYSNRLASDIATLTRIIKSYRELVSKKDYRPLLIILLLLSVIPFSTQTLTGSAIYPTNFNIILLLLSIIVILLLNHIIPPISIGG